MRPAVELLSPAGDMERLRAAVTFGADAVYLGGLEFGMRSSSANFSAEQLSEAVTYAHGRDVRVYLTCNTLPRNDEIARLPQFIRQAEDAGVDGYIVSDLGVFHVIRRLAPGAELHVSTQAGVVNYETARFFYELGAKRVVLARELPLEEIAEIRAKIPLDMEIEAFVHGAMCMSFSGRCLLSDYMTGRGANRGDCAQPCRWKYALMEEKRPGQYFPIEEEEGGSYLLNSKDMCMIDYLPQMIQAGITSLKIEGRAKSAYYVALTTNAYRQALDAYLANPEECRPEPWLREELNKISHREYSSGFYLGNEPGQVYSNGGYVREYEVVGIVAGWNSGILTLSQRNRFFLGDVLEILEPGKQPYEITVTAMKNERGEEITSAPHATMLVNIPMEHSVSAGSYLRKAKG